MSLRTFGTRAAIALALFVGGGFIATLLTWVVVLMWHSALYGGGLSIEDEIAIPCAGVLVGFILALSYLTLPDYAEEPLPPTLVSMEDGEPEPGASTPPGLEPGIWRAREQEHPRGDQPTPGVPLFSCTAPQLYGDVWKAEKIVRVFAWDVDPGEMNSYPTAVRIEARTPQELAIALEAIKDSPASFVLYQGYRYTARGEGQVYDPARPASADELCLEFEVEDHGLDERGRPRICLYTCEAEWETVRQAVSHLLRQELLSPLSHIESESRAMAVTDLLHQHLSPESGSVVSVTREPASRAQDGLEGVDMEDDEA